MSERQSDEWNFTSERLSRANETHTTHKHEVMLRGWQRTGPMTLRRVYVVVATIVVLAAAAAVPAPPPSPPVVKVAAWDTIKTNDLPHTVTYQILRSMSEAEFGHHMKLFWVNLSNCSRGRCLSGVHSVFVRTTIFVAPPSAPALARRRSQGPNHNTGPYLFPRLARLSYITAGRQHQDHTQRSNRDSDFSGRGPCDDGAGRRRRRQAGG